MRILLLALYFIGILHTLFAEKDTLNLGDYYIYGRDKTVIKEERKYIGLDDKLIDFGDFIHGVSKEEALGSNLFGHYRVEISRNDLPFRIDMGAGQKDGAFISKGDIHYSGPAGSSIVSENLYFGHKKSADDVSGMGNRIGFAFTKLRISHNIFYGINENYNPSEKLFYNKIRAGYKEDKYKAGLRIFHFNYSQDISDEFSFLMNPAFEYNFGQLKVRGELFTDAEDAEFSAEALYNPGKVLGLDYSVFGLGISALKEPFDGETGYFIVPHLDIRQELGHGKGLHAFVSTKKSMIYNDGGEYFLENRGHAAWDSTNVNILSPLINPHYLIDSRKYGYSASVRYSPGSELAIIGSMDYDNWQKKINRYEVSEDLSWLKAAADIEWKEVNYRVGFRYEKIFLIDEPDIDCPVAEDKLVLSGGGEYGAFSGMISVSGNFNRESMDNYTIINSRLGYRLNENTEIYLSAENLADEDYNIGPTFKGERFSLLLGCNWNFGL